MRLLSTSLFAVGAVGLLAVTASAQGRNVTRVGGYDPGEFVNDVWGYADPQTGKEYAMLCAYGNVYVVDCANPASPVVRGSFSSGRSGWSQSTWRDARTFGDYLYVVTEGGGGMQIIDISDPDNPTFVRTWTAPGVSWSNTHNISVDTDAGIAYACGTGAGTLVIDLNQDPSNPTYVARYTGAYVHDMQARDGLAFLAQFPRRNQSVQIVDVSNLPNLVSRGQHPVSSCHTSWPTRDMQYCVATSEEYGGGITIIDVRNVNAPSTVATWRTGGSQTIVHNAFMRDRVCHMSYYSEGYRSVDLSNPGQPVDVGSFDTSPAHTSGYEGAWGCYPFQPSGHVYMSDMDHGLVILRPKSTTEEYGVASPGTNGIAPTAHTFGAAYVGNSAFGLEVDEAAANASAFFLLGLMRSNVTYQGLTLLVDTTAGGILSATTDADGRGHVNLAVPSDNSLNGARMHFQAFVVDPNGPLGFSASTGMTLDLFIR